MVEEKPVTEQIWNDFARLNAGERFRQASSEMGTAVTEAIVAAARIAPGVRVLDVACGAGEPAISIAAALAGAGHVTGVDLSEGPLEVARARAAKRGLTNISFQQADVHGLPFADASFERVTSRLGVMFFSDLPRAFAELHRVLVPGGRVALLAWGALEQPYFERTIGTIRRLRPQLAIPQGEAQIMFRFDAAGSLGAALREVGFTGVEEQLHHLAWDWHGTPAELWDYFRSITVPFRALLQKVEGDAEVEQAVLAALAEHYDGEYVRCQAQMVIATGEK
jgi:ubiquinone/menaquinone biosynthesis C-methylase UbiE